MEVDSLGKYGQALHDLTTYPTLAAFEGMRP